ncbi:MAG: hypothetical protein R3E58_00340 [Phycisphaerae bacterium]
MSLNEYGFESHGLDSNGVAADMLEQSLAILEKYKERITPKYSR